MSGKKYLLADLMVVVIYFEFRDMKKKDGI